MRLKHDSRIVKWAYLLSAHVPERTTLCAIFWRAVLTPLPFLLIALLSPLVGLAIWKDPIGFGLSLASVFGFVGVMVLLGARRERMLKRRASQSPSQPSAPSVLWQGFKAAKSKVCPLVEIVK